MRLPRLAPDRGRQIPAGFGRAHVLVVGDAMIDAFVVGRVTRLSPEAPVPVVAFERELTRLGGAANVAHNVVALGGAATLVAVAGADDAGDTLRAHCAATGITPALVVDRARRTTRKMRVVTERNQQVARVDYEDDRPIGDTVESAVIDAIRHHAAAASAIVVSDYLKGAVTAAVAGAAVAAGASRGIPVLVDPKIPHVAYYRGAAVVTPNHHEAESATHVRVRSDEDARRAARAFRDLSACDAVLMTRGDQGLWLLAADADGSLPAAAREVADVTGAGDTVVATCALALSAGATLVEAAHLANAAAGVAVGKFGSATVSPAELAAAVADTSRT